MHEAGVPMLGPVIAYVLMLEIGASPNRKRTAACLVLLALLVPAILVVANSSLVPEAAEAMYQRLQARADYPLRRDAFDVLVRDVWTNLRIMSWMWQSRDYVVEFVTSFVVAVPVVVFLLASTIGMLLRRGHGRWLIAVAVLASLAPLFMHAVAWDSARFNTLAITTSYLVLLATVLYGRQTVAAAEPSPSRRTVIIGGLIVTMSLVASVPLFDGYRVKPFPYPDHLGYLRGALSGQEAFPARPAHR
jgi:hypothetical protein